MSWPDTRICTGCKKIFDRDNCKIDIGDFWNNSDEIFAVLKNVLVMQKING